MHMTSSEKSRINAVDREAGHNALGFLRDLQKIGADNRNVINHGTWEIWGVGRGLFTVQKCMNQYH
jgi:hypothetical protein